ncbi:hypothetical protein AX16_010563 [Volvariella volvacea WC 439]|nr:hypothetical protein AX16_010563 [Volvariella volvacea WC 439]
MYSILRIRDGAWANVQVYHTSFVKYLHDASRSNGSCIYNPKVVNFLLLKAIRLADTSGHLSTLWLNIHASIPGDDILFIPALQNALAQVNAKHWLRLCLLSLRTVFDWEEIGGKYNTFRQCMFHHISKDEKYWLSINPPDDVFPPLGCGFNQHWLRNWAKDF